MGKRYLIITEGQNDEKNVFETIFEKYGFNVINIKEQMEIEEVGQFDKIEYELGNINIVLVQGPRNRIHDMLLLFGEQMYSIERAFSYTYGTFAGIFLVYDVDHNDCEDVEKMFKKFQDESTGMLLLSSPCFDVIGDYNQKREESRYHKITEYKSDLNNYYAKNYQSNVIDFIKDNFDKLIIRFIKENKEEFNSNNVMEHPSLIINKINSMNERINLCNKDDSYVIYRYFSTVVYVAIAYAHNLTKEINNVEGVIKFFKTNSVK